VAATNNLTYLLKTMCTVLLKGVRKTCMSYIQQNLSFLASFLFYWIMHVILLTWSVV